MKPKGRLSRGAGKKGRLRGARVRARARHVSLALLEQQRTDGSWKLSQGLPGIPRG
jgi:hypothetical protein